MRMHSFSVMKSGLVSSVNPMILCCAVSFIFWACFRVFDVVLFAASKHFFMNQLWYFFGRKLQVPPMIISSSFEVGWPDCFNAVILFWTCSSGWNLLRSALAAAGCVEI